jgi:hypothetical protein
MAGTPGCGFGSANGRVGRDLPDPKISRNIKANMEPRMSSVEEREERRKAKLEALRAEIQKGFDSGPMEEIGNVHEWFEGIKARGRERFAAQKLGKKV